MTRQPSTPTLRGYVRFLRIAFAASPGLSVTTALSTALSGAAPLALVGAVGAIVGRIPEVARAGPGSPATRAALLWSVAAGALLLAQWAASALQTAAATALGDRIDYVLQRELMDTVMTPAGIAHLEDPHSLHLIDVGRDTFRTWLKPGRLALTLGSLASGRLVMIGSCLILFRFRWPAALALLAAALWAEHEDKVASRVEADHHYGGTEQARRTEYYYELGVSPPAAKEIRVFGLNSFLLRRYQDSWNRSMEQVFAKGGRRPLAAAAALGAAALGSLAWICVDATRGRLGIGPAIVFAQAINVGLGAVRSASWASLQSELTLATLRRYEAAADLLRGIVESGGASRLGDSPAAGPVYDIRFEEVSFRYPGGDHDVLRGLDLVVPAGRSLAIVGANGAGKTTLVKLLCALYGPTTGAIRIDGTDLSQREPESWRRRIAVAFQDSVHYEMPARTNVGFGSVADANDLDGVRDAAGAAGAAEAIEALPLGWDTILSSNYRDGADLSGGEWQKVGLARALFAVRHGACVLILDEPAAHLDARAEAQLYERFLAITSGVTTIVISHRFSTVRQASSIAVLKGGRVTEQGTHDELMQLGGEYAEMFRLQAARFEDRVEQPVADR